MSDSCGDEPPDDLVDTLGLDFLQSDWFSCVFINKWRNIKLVFILLKKKMYLYSRNLK